MHRSRRDILASLAAASVIGCRGSTHPDGTETPPTTHPTPPFSLPSDPPTRTTGPPAPKSPPPRFGNYGQVASGYVPN